MSYISTGSSDYGDLRDALSDARASQGGLEDACRMTEDDLQRITVHFGDDGGTGETLCDRLNALLEKALRLSSENGRNQRGCMHGWRMDGVLGIGAYGTVLSGHSIRDPRHRRAFKLIMPNPEEEAGEVEPSLNGPADEVRAQNRFAQHGLSVRIHCHDMIQNNYNDVFHLLTMDEITDTPFALFSFPRMLGLCLDLLQRLRKLGYTHGDAHFGNMYLAARNDGRGGERLMLIDFGRASTSLYFPSVDAEQMLFSFAKRYGLESDEVQEATRAFLLFLNDEDTRDAMTIHYRTVSWGDEFGVGVPDRPAMDRYLDLVNLAREMAHWRPDTVTRRWTRDQVDAFRRLVFRLEVDHANSAAEYRNTPYNEFVRNLLFGDAPTGEDEETQGLETFTVDAVIAGAYAHIPVVRLRRNSSTAFVLDAMIVRDTMTPPRDLLEGYVNLFKEIGAPIQFATQRYFFTGGTHLLIWKRKDGVEYVPPEHVEPETLARAFVALMLVLLRQNRTIHGVGFAKLLFMYRKRDGRVWIVPTEGRRTSYSTNLKRDAAGFLVDVRTFFLGADYERIRRLVELELFGSDEVRNAAREHRHPERFAMPRGVIAEASGI